MGRASGLPRHQDRVRHWRIAADHLQLVWWRRGLRRVPHNGQRPLKNNAIVQHSGRGLEKNMQSIRPSQLTDEEVLRQVYLMGNESLPKEWVEELCTRMARLIDDKINTHQEGFEEGFAAGVNVANDPELK